MNINCKFCSKEIIGRKGKVFCDHYCKSAFHYEKNKPKPDSRYKIVNDQLRLNRKLLKNFNKAGKATIRKEKLMEQGFNPRIFTNYLKNKNGQVYLFCYDFGQFLF